MFNLPDISIKSECPFYVECHIFIWEIEVIW